MVTIGVPLMWTAGVSGALQGGSNLDQGDILAGSAHFGSGHMLQFRSSTAAPGPGTNRIDGFSQKPYIAMLIPAMLSVPVASFYLDVVAAMPPSMQCCKVRMCSRCHVTVHQSADLCTPRVLLSQCKLRS